MAHYFKKKIIVTLMVISFFLLLSETILLPWFKAFIKTGDHQVYLIIYYLLMFLFLPLILKIEKKPFLLVALIGLLLGLLFSLISIIFLGIYQGGIDIWINAYNSYGISYFISTIWGAFILGGWLFGLLIFVLSRFSIRYIKNIRQS
ncbi:MAG: hypothetical protein OQL19_16800 [Gammaproteobacteria bacterium]|nr:hypothetical protein [Gammaproteobacteria bacterium]